MGRPQLHDESTEHDLLAAAEQLLAHGGAEALSVRRVAEAAGTSSRAIYSRFGGMDGLLSALFATAFHALSADLDRLPLTRDPLSDLVRVGVGGFRPWARARPTLFRLAFSAETPVTPAASRAGVEAFERLRSRVRRCAEAGLMAPQSEAEVALSFHALCEGLASLEARGRFPLDPSQDPEMAWRNALTALVKGYCNAP